MRQHNKRDNIITKYVRISLYRPGGNQAHRLNQSIEPINCFISVILWTVDWNRLIIGPYNFANTSRNHTENEHRVKQVTFVCGYRPVSSQSVTPAKMWRIIQKLNNLQHKLNRFNQMHQTVYHRRADLRLTFASFAWSLSIILCLPECEFLTLACSILRFNPSSHFRFCSSRSWIFRRTLASCSLRLWSTSFLKRGVEILTL